MSEHILRSFRVPLLTIFSAARLAMNVLKTGGSAVDAVEIAIKCLEDREITNAGYGSNLAMDGVVECDAIIVDHNGRSGGAGAVARKSLMISTFFMYSQLTFCRNKEPDLPRQNSTGPLRHAVIAAPRAT
jgi:hypothetical protein